MKMQSLFTVFSAVAQRLEQYWQVLPSGLTIFERRKLSTLCISIRHQLTFLSVI